jgi:outer membrane protein OmpA-like peptidoglycan-associated protein
MNYQLSFEAESFGGIPEYDEYEYLEIEDLEGWEGETGRDSPQQVRWIQESLNKVLGLKLTVDGIMESQTRSAVRSFQRKHRLLADGIVGPATIRALVSAGANPPATTFPSDVIVAADARLDGFDFDKSNLKPSHIADIAKIADKIVKSWRDGKPFFTVKVVGHTDPEGSTQHNQALGLRRALAVRKELQNALKRKQRDLYFKVLVLASSRGENERVDISNTPRGNARNRRVEIFLSTKKLLPSKPKPKPKPKPPITTSTIDIYGSIPKPDKSPPTCKKAEWNRLINECIANSKNCVFANCTGRLSIELAACLGNPVCNAAVTAKYLHCLYLCKNTLNSCRAGAERASNCKEGDW